MDITRSADKVICLIYKEFLDRRNSGASIEDARDFSDAFCMSLPKLSSMNPSDVETAFQELNDADYIKRYITGDFDLTNSGIIYMESRFGDNVKNVLDWIGKLIGAIPFV